MSNLFQNPACHRHFRCLLPSLRFTLKQNQIQRIPFSPSRSSSLHHHLWGMGCVFGHPFASLMSSGALICPAGIAVLCPFRTADPPILQEPSFCSQPRSQGQKASRCRKESPWVLVHSSTFSRVSLLRANDCKGPDGL